MVSTSASSLAKKLGLGTQNSREYTAHTSDVKRKFLREDHPHLVAGKEAILEEDGTSAHWEQGIAELYEAYPDLWQTEKFASRTERAAFVNFLIVA